MGDEPSRRAQGDGPARGLHAILAKRNRTLPHGRNHPPTKAFALPLWPWLQHRHKKHGIQASRRLQGSSVRPAQIRFHRGTAPSHRQGCERNARRAAAPDMGRGHDCLCIGLKAIRGLGPESAYRIPSPLWRPWRHGLLACRKKIHMHLFPT